MAPRACATSLLMVPFARARKALSVLGRLLVGVRQREHVDLAEGAAAQLQPDGQAPPRLKPHGTLTAGMPYALKGPVLRRRIVVASSGDASAASTLTGSRARVGVTRMSTSSNTAATAFLASAS